jgi:hypothetical protein
MTKSRVTLLEMLISAVVLSTIVLAVPAEASSPLPRMACANTTCVQGGSSCWYNPGCRCIFGTNGKCEGDEECPIE